MQDLLQYLSTTLPFVALGCVLVVLLLHIITHFKKYFLQRVNCWFCNSWIKVPYEQKNSFNCTVCLQYNGFTPDGNYNKIIKEQHEVSVLHSRHNKSDNLMNSNNGLCKLCNNNMRLKVYQLAHFVPINEDNYDMEIEHFEKQLEKAYQLCSKCNQCLKQKLELQNCKLFGLNFKPLSLLNSKLHDKLVDTHSRYGQIFRQAALTLFLFYCLLSAMYKISYIKQIVLEVTNLQEFKHCLKVIAGFVYVFKKYSVTYYNNSAVSKISQNGLEIVNVANDMFTRHILNATQYHTINTTNVYQIVEVFTDVLPAFNYLEITFTCALFLAFYIYTAMSSVLGQQYYLCAWLILIITNVSSISGLGMNAMEIAGILYLLYCLHFKKQKPVLLKKLSRNSFQDSASSSFGDSSTTFNCSNDTSQSSNFGNYTNKYRNDTFQSPFSAFSRYNGTNGTRPNILGKTENHVFGQNAWNQRCPRKSVTVFSEKSQCNTCRSSYAFSECGASANNVKQFDTASLYGNLYNRQNTKFATTDLPKSFLNLRINNDNSNCHNIPLKRYSHLDAILNRRLPEGRINRPILSPAKLNFTYNNTKSNNIFHKEDIYGSRSSSQSSGFASISKDVFSSLPSSPVNSINGDTDRGSLYSEAFLCGSTHDNECHYNNIRDLFRPINGDSFQN